jgi:hypothetical protein
MPNRSRIQRDSSIRAVSRARSIIAAAMNRTNRADVDFAGGCLLRCRRHAPSLQGTPEILDAMRQRSTAGRPNSRGCDSLPRNGRASPAKAPSGTKRRFAPARWVVGCGRAARTCSPPQPAPESLPGPRRDAEVESGRRRDSDSASGDVKVARPDGRRPAPRPGGRVPHSGSKNTSLSPYGNDDVTYRISALPLAYMKLCTARSFGPTVRASEVKDPDPRTLGQAAPRETAAWPDHQTPPSCKPRPGQRVGGTPLPSSGLLEAVIRSEFVRRAQQFDVETVVEGLATCTIGWEERS